MKTATTRRRIVLLLLGVTAAGMGALQLWARMGRVHAEELAAKERDEKRASIRSILAVDSSRLCGFVYDSTFWDEMVKFVSHPAALWAQQNIDASLPSLGACGAWVYDPSMRLVYSARLDGEAEGSMGVTADELRRAFSGGTRFIHFYARHGGALVEIQGATIHATVDVSRTGPVHGYFLVGRVWNAAHLARLGQLVGAQVAIGAAPLPGGRPLAADTGRYRVTIPHALPGIDGRGDAAVLFTVDLPILRQYDQTMLGMRNIVVGLVAAIMVVLAACLIVWVKNPLDMIARSLGSGNPAGLVQLLNTRSELGSLAMLIREWFMREQQLAERSACLERAIAMRDEAEHSLRLTQFAVDHAADAVFWLDRDGRILYVNEAACSLFQGTHEELTGVSVFDLDPDLTSEALALVLSDLAAGATVRVEREYTSRSGTRVPVEVQASAAHFEGREVYCCFARDITERRRVHDELAHALDAAEAGARAKGQFLANMSHEIRTPMNAVIGMTELLLNMSLTPDQRECIEAVQRSGEALLAIINDVLDLSKIEAGRMELETGVVDLAGMVEDVGELLAPACREKRIELALCVGLDLPAQLAGDPVRIRQILLNLAGNAVKFTEAGEVSIRAELRSREAGMASVRLSVHDTGIGIPEAKQAAVFDSFAQADAGTSRRFGGTGLGLTISRHLAEMMGGNIGLRSVEGEGSVFWLDLTLPEIAGADTGLAPLPELRGVQALVAEANATSRAAVARLLEAWGAHVIEAASCSEAESLLAESLPVRIGLLLAAARLPDAGGASLVHWARRSGLAAVLLTWPGAQSDPLPAQCEVVHVPIRREALRLAILRALAGQDSGTTEDSTERIPIRGDARLCGLRVLVVEDNPVNRKVASRMLQAIGCEVLIAANGEEGVAAAHHVHPDIVLMDCQMPGMDGFEATMAIRHSEEESIRLLPIIAMTANTMEGDRERCLAAGMDDYIGKPFRSGQLVEVLLRCRSRPVDGERKVA